MSPLEQIASELNWRESELGSLKILLGRRDLSSGQREVLLRAAWAILYAHYEGFSKFCLTVFYDEGCKRVKECGLLPKATRLRGLLILIKKIKSLPDDEFLDEVEGFCTKYHSVLPVFPSVDTNSNLWPELLTCLLNGADIDPSVVSRHHAKLRTLVARRNAISHGEKDIIAAVSYYLEFEATVYDLMCELAFLVDERLSKPPYAHA